MSCGLGISLATKGIICCSGKITKQLVTSLCLNLKHKKSCLNLKIHKNKLNFKIKCQD